VGAGHFIRGRDQTGVFGVLAVLPRYNVLTSSKLGHVMAVARINWKDIPREQFIYADQLPLNMVHRQEFDSADDLDEPLLELYLAQDGRVRVVNKPRSEKKVLVVDESVLDSGDSTDFQQDEQLLFSENGSRGTLSHVELDSVELQASYGDVVAQSYWEDQVDK
jgi:hypothetical protein